jgi:hypothetical protein
MTPYLPPHNPDDIDAMLSKYFKNEMPKKWPAAPAVDVEPVQPFARNSSTSRWALAASVMLLVGVCWYAGRGTTPGERPPSATVNKFEKGAKAEDKSILNEMQKHRTVQEP